MTNVKICGLTREEDIGFVNIVKPEYIGFVFAESKRKVTSKQASQLKKMLDPTIKAVGVFVNESIEVIVENINNGVIDLVQLHGDEDENYIKELKQRVNVPIIKAVSISSKGNAQMWENTNADYLLLDNKCGGSGMAFDWTLIGKVNKPFFLAGGIDISNVGNALCEVSPFAVDISSGVETDNYKDFKKIQTIVRRIRNGEG